MIFLLHYTMAMRGDSRGQKKRRREGASERTIGPTLPGRTIAIAYAATEALSPSGTSAIVFRICEAIWYGSPMEFGRRSSI
jgi:hypothetical protein